MHERAARGKDKGGEREEEGIFGRKERKKGDGRGRGRLGGKRRRWKIRENLWTRGSTGCTSTVGPVDDCQYNLHEDTTYTRTIRQRTKKKNQLTSEMQTVCVRETVLSFTNVYRYIIYRHI